MTLAVNLMVSMASKGIVYIYRERERVGHILLYASNPIKYSTSCSAKIHVGERPRKYLWIHAFTPIFFASPSDEIVHTNNLQLIHNE